ncbi:LysR family transcriptional regulator [Roseovarius sp. Pro17]|uniref:LysR family transcriptional regulator n=1 Tax=Roseovarius sp. Pro17 TaxID=3108175 RepID=UPI002D767940|nr:LysR family transcriptional regulator [Roseovarius sp. Pro17]
MMKLPSMRALQAFDAVGRLLNMTKAAHELNVSPSAISQQIKILENAIGMRLLVRKSSGLVLTEVGSAYHQAISTIFADLNKTSSEIVDHYRSNALVVSSLPLLASRWLSTNMFTWQEAHPDISLHLVGAVTEPTADNRKKFDFRITYGEKAHLFDHSVPLFTDSLTPVYSPKLGISGPDPQPGDLLKHRLLTIDWQRFLSPAPTWQDWFSLFGIDGREIDEFFTFSLSSLAIEAAMEGRGVALIQKALVVEEIKAGYLIAPFDQALALPSPYILAWNDAVFDKDGASEFHRWLVGLARQQPSAASTD